MEIRGRLLDGKNVRTRTIYVVGRRAVRGEARTLSDLRLLTPETKATPFQRDCFLSKGKQNQEWVATWTMAGIKIVKTDVNWDTDEEAYKTRLGSQQERRNVLRKVTISRECELAGDNNDDLEGLRAASCSISLQGDFMATSKGRGHDVSFPKANGLRHGEGRRVWANGARYEGR